MMASVRLMTYHQQSLTLVYMIIRTFTEDSRNEINLPLFHAVLADGAIGRRSKVQNSSASYVI